MIFENFGQDGFRNYKQLKCCRHIAKVMQRSSELLSSVFNFAADSSELQFVPICLYNILMSHGRPPFFAVCDGFKREVIQFLRGRRQTPTKASSKE